MITTKILAGIIIIGIEAFIVKPTLNVMWVVLVCVGIDFVTGIMKAKKKQQARTSEGFRKTAVKFSQYILPILALYAAMKFIPEKKEIIEYAFGGFMMFVIYIEFTSIIENIYEMDKTSPISKYIYKNLLKILKFGLENNPVNKAAEKIEGPNPQISNNEKPIS